MSAPGALAPSGLAPGPPAVLLPSRRGGPVLGRVATPLLVAAVLVTLFLFVRARGLDSIEARTLNADYLLARTGEHLLLSVTASALIVVIAIPLGVLLSRVRSRAVSTVVLGLANVGQAAPVIGVLVMLTIVFGTGFRVALVGIVAYAVLPVLRNTLVGIEGIDPALTEAARGIGMTRNQVLLRIELPLAVPVVLAGLRTALVFAVGVATIATFVNAGGLGDIIVNGIKLQRWPVLVTGSVLTASIALLVDWLASLLEDRLRPQGA